MGGQDQEICLETFGRQFCLAGDEGGCVKLELLARRWSSIVRNRRRWTDKSNAYAQLMGRAASDLSDVGVSREAQYQLAEAGVVQVGLPWVDDGRHWPIRLLPWEFLLGAATKQQRGDKPLVVTRHLRLREDAQPPIADDSTYGKGAPKQALLIVVSAPGRIGNVYSFGGECQLVKNNVSNELEATELWNPTAEQFCNCIAHKQPRIVHLTGVDSHQGAELLAEPRNPLRRDGFYFKGKDNRPNAIPAEQIRSLLLEARCAADFIAFNCHYSSGWLAPMALAGGARSALGFQDEINDDVAEQFFADFYDSLGDVGSQVNPLAAFGVAFQLMRRRNLYARDFGVTFWSSSSLLEGWDPKLIEVFDEVRRYGRLNDLHGRLAPCRDGQPRRTGSRKSSRQKLTTSDIRVDIRPSSRLNYALLHNDRPLFEKFSIQAPGFKHSFKLDVEVALQLGRDSIIYRKIHTVNESADISNDIRIPLTWVHAHALNEGVRTSFLVKIYKDDDLFEALSFPVLLLPPDEWRDTEEDRTLLPSFVYPRDPAVSMVVGAAQRYLCVLRDDPTAGFNGYQAAMGPDADDEIDRQVRSIWHALLHDFRLNYINPPPSYGHSVQRIRTPSQIMNEKCGTCIELALFLAACLEWVDIYPVIFLLKGHALTGYWRSAKDHADFFGPFGSGWDEDDPDDGVRDDPWITAQREKVLQKEGWKVEDREAIMRLVESEQVVPLEAVSMTERLGVDAAARSAKETLEPYNLNDLDAMLDIIRARRDPYHPSTPLPLLRYHS